MPFYHTPVVPFSSKRIEEWLKECREFTNPLILCPNRTSIGPNTRLSLHDFLKVTYWYASAQTNNKGLELSAFYTCEDEESPPFLFNFLAHPRAEQTVTGRSRIFPLDILESLESGIEPSAIFTFRKQYDLLDIDERRFYMPFVEPNF